MSVRLTRRALNVGAAYRALPDDRAGGVAIFIGRSRVEGQGRDRIRALTYEADVGMAVRELGRLEREVARRFGVRRAIIWHRLGRVPVGEASVVIAVATSHRAEAFRACRFLIDELKTRVPIWKAPDRRARPARRN